MPIELNSTACASLLLALMKDLRARGIGTLALAALMSAVGACRKAPGEAPRNAASTATQVQVFSVKGVVRELKPDGRTLVVRHEEIPNYMAAMTMPFCVNDTNELSMIQPGDEITFRLSVTDDKSWIDHVRKTGRKFAGEAADGGLALTITPPPDHNILEALSTY